ncbi:MAG: hypothetical protein ABJ327_18005 [Litoreibacter sp.]
MAAKSRQSAIRRRRAKVRFGDLSINPVGTNHASISKLIWFHFSHTGTVFDMFGALRLFGRRLTTICLICTFMSFGFVHKNIQPPMVPELAAYVAAGGSIFDICGGDHQPGHEDAVDCEACRVADNLTMLQGCDRIASVELERIQTWRFIAKRLAESQGLDPARLTRAPPYV